MGVASTKSGLPALEWLVIRFAPHCSCAHGRPTAAPLADLGALRAAMAARKGASCLGVPRSCRTAGVDARVPLRVLRERLLAALGVEQGWPVRARGLPASVCQ